MLSFARTGHYRIPRPPRNLIDRRHRPDREAGRGRLGPSILTPVGVLGPKEAPLVVPFTQFHMEIVIPHAEPALQNRRWGHRAASGHSLPSASRSCYHERTLVSIRFH